MAAPTILSMHRTLRWLSALLLLIALNLPGLVSATATPGLTINGSGWGDGVGLSQYGARAMADGGASVDEILSHYFTGTTLRQLDTLSSGSELLSLDEPLWVGLLQNQPEITFRIEEGTADLCLDGTDACSATAAAGEKWRFGPDGFEQCAFSRQAGDGGYVLFAPSGDCSASVRPTSVDGTIQIPRKGRSYRYGTFRIRTSPTSGRLHLSHQVGIEDYLRGVQEIPEFWPGASLEAQVVVSRSLVGFRLIDVGPAEDFDIQRLDLCACHILDTDPEQAYGGYTSELGHPFWQGRVGATSGLVITKDNQVIWARFTSSTGGRTESNDATGGEHLPYLVSVDDAASVSGPADNPYSSWAVHIDQAELGLKFGFLWLTDATVTSKYESGTAQTVRLAGIIAGRPATVTTTGSAIRDALGLRSSYFDIDVVPRFADVQVSHPFAGEILGLSELGITTGCTQTEFCPSDPVTREQMAAFLTRALDLASPSAATNTFGDDDGSIFETDIEAIFARGITTGCTQTEFCPSDPVTREQMAAFLTRALTLPSE
ncbi:MAG: hypothetical protein HOD33_11295 [Acidiferrobacteraceae bacterium]|nr:hypothetical protein [Acidiferrobacteraceae bacterium]